MIAFIVASIFLCASASAQNVNERNYGCMASDFATENYNVVSDSRRYALTAHVDHDISFTANELTLSWSATVCFDTPQCISAPMGVYSYTSLGEGIHCFTFVSYGATQLNAGEEGYFGFHSYGVNGQPGSISTITINGNGVLEESMAVEIPPSSASEYCKSCEGSYVADMQSCGVFYKCLNKQAIPFSCAATTAFNPVINVCDYLKNAGCYASSTHGTRRVQCSAAANNCPPLSEAGEKIYDQTYHISACTHSDSPPTTAPPPTTSA